MTYGPLLSADDVCDAVLATCRAWMPAVLAEMARRADEDPRDEAKWPPIRTWEWAAELDQLQPEQLPALIVTSAGLDDEPEVDGDGIYSVRWQVNITIALRGDDFHKTTRQLRRYITAARTIAVQQGSHGIDASTVWTGEDYAAFGPVAARTLQMATATFSVALDDVLEAYAGPLEPPEDPYAVPPAANQATTQTVIEHPAD